MTQKNPPTAHPKGNEGYAAMTEALRNDPQALRAMLAARKKDLMDAFTDAEMRGDGEQIAQITSALAQIGAAQRKLNGNGDISVTAGVPEVPVPSPVSAAEDEEGLSIKGPPDPAATTVDMEPPEPDLPDINIKPSSLSFNAPKKEEEGPENPVKMNGRLRRQMGDVAADFFDEYALAIHEKVQEFFTDLKGKVLDLGEEDETDDTLSLRETIVDQLGKRGLERVLPAFPEWRASMIRQIGRELNTMFEHAPQGALEDDRQESLLGIDLPEEGAEGESVEDSGEAKTGTEPPDSNKLADEVDKLETPQASVQAAPEASREVMVVDVPAEKTEQVVAATGAKEPEGVPEEILQAPVRVASGPMRFTAVTNKPIQRDFKPSGHSSPTLE